MIKEASFAKLFATEAASRIINESLQIHGGVGLQKGERIERLYPGGKGSDYLRRRFRDSTPDHRQIFTTRTAQLAQGRGTPGPRLSRTPLAQALLNRLAFPGARPHTRARMN